MNKTEKNNWLAVKIPFYFIAALCVFLGCVYSFKTGLMPYHYHLMGMTPEQIDSGIVLFLVTAKQITGGLMLGSGLALGLITRRIHSHTALLLPVMAVLLLVPVLVSAYAVFRVGETIPGIMVSLIIILTAAGFLVIWKKSRDNKR